MHVIQSHAVLTLCVKCVKPQPPSEALEGSGAEAQRAVAQHAQPSARQRASIRREPQARPKQGHDLCVYVQLGNMLSYLHFLVPESMLSVVRHLAHSVWHMGAHACRARTDTQRQLASNQPCLSNCIAGRMSEHQMLMQLMGTSE